MYLEDRLEPDPHTKDPRRDVLCVALLGVLAAWLIWQHPAMIDARLEAATPPLADPSQSFGRVDEPITTVALKEVLRSSMSCYLLAAIGWVLALRRGAVDVGVWVNMGIGGLVAAALINHTPLRDHPAGAMLAAGLAGAAIGLAGGLLCSRVRVPAPIATGALALGGLVVCEQLFQVRQVAIPTEVFYEWGQVLDGVLGPKESDASIDGPLIAGRMVLVAAGWTVVMGTLAIRDAAGIAAPTAPGPRKNQLAFGLTMSGALAGLAGAIWVLEKGAAPVPTRLVDDLTIPTAAVLAGAMFLVGRSRTMLAMLLLPIGVMVGQFWQIMSPPQQWGGLSVPLMLLTIQVGSVHLASLAPRPPGEVGRVLSVAVRAGMMAGLVVTTAPMTLGIRTSLHLRATGLWIWGVSLAAGLVVAVLGVVAQRRAALSRGNSASASKSA